MRASGGLFSMLLIYGTSALLSVAASSWRLFDVNCSNTDSESFRTGIPEKATLHEYARGHPYRSNRKLLMSNHHTNVAQSMDGESLSVLSRDRSSFEVIDSISEMESFTFWVVIPAFNAEVFVEETIDSVRKQLQEQLRVRLVFIDDGSSDGTRKVLERRRGKGDEILVQDERCGSACSKWAAFQYLQVESQPLDIVVIVDGDDYFIRPDALLLLFEVHFRNNIWFTYGSFYGRYAEQVGMHGGGEFRNRPWVYGHPRSFRAGLLKHITKSDFTDTDGNYLQKGSERGFVYKFLELCGSRRIYYVSAVLYKYRDHSGNSFKLLSRRQRQRAVRRFNSESPVQELNDIHVIFCVYARGSHLAPLLGALEQQTVAAKLRLHVCINNRTLTTYVEEYRRNSNLSITSHTFHQNSYGYGRFLVAKQVLANQLVDYFIFIDDDQSFNETYIERLWAHRKPRAYRGWFGKRFHGSSYWREFSPTVPQLRNGEATHITTFQYVGTGGSIIDASIFLMNSVFRCPGKFHSVEDLWLSHVVASLGWDRDRIFARPMDLQFESSALHRESGMRDRKAQLLDWIQKHNYKF